MVRVARVHVDPQQLAQQRVESLAHVERVAARPAIAGADVEVAVGPEGDPAAVVIGEGLRDLEQDLDVARIGDVRIVVADAVLA